MLPKIRKARTYGLSSNIRNTAQSHLHRDLVTAKFCVGWSQLYHRSRAACALVLLAHVPTNLGDGTPVHVFGMYILMIL
jgi:hypothetical protein